MSATERDTFGVTFDGEAWETFRMLLQHIEGWTVEVTTEDDEVFDAMVVGPPLADTSEWVNEARVQRLDEQHIETVGQPFNVRVRNLHVY